MAEVAKNHNSEFGKLRYKIERLKAGEPYSRGGHYDVEMIEMEIEKLRKLGGHFISAEEADLLLEELKTVDPSLSTLEAREARRKIKGTFEYRMKEGITEEEAQKLVDERGLEDGIYPVAFKKAGFPRAFIILRNGEVKNGVFNFEDYEIAELFKKNSDLDRKDIIVMDSKLID